MGRFVLAILDSDGECVNILTETNYPTKMIKFIKSLRLGSLFNDHCDEDSYIELLDCLHCQTISIMDSFDNHHVPKNMIRYLNAVINGVIK